MADQTKIELDGDRELRATLARAENDLEELDQSENGRLVEQRARAGAPKLSGALANSVRASDAAGGTVEIASDLIYAAPIHYGWPAHNISPNPFLAEALADSESVIEANNLREANRILERVRGA